MRSLAVLLSDKYTRVISYLIIGRMTRENWYIFHQKVLVSERSLKIMRADSGGNSHNHSLSAVATFLGSLNNHIFKRLFTLISASTALPSDCIRKMP